MNYRSNIKRNNNSNLHNRSNFFKNNEQPNLHLLKKPETIPLPNEVEGGHMHEDEQTRWGKEKSPNESKAFERLTRYLYSKFPFLEKTIKHIHTDDIILIGMIILLLDENADDNYLIIILAYLLLADLELFDF